MDAKVFTSGKTGELIAVDVPWRDWAFIPDPLPPKNWRIPDRLWPLLTKAAGRLGELNGIGRTLPDPELLQRPLENREALRSSSLEGTYASPEELLLFEMNPRPPKSESDRANAWLEVLNYGSALRAGFHRLASIPLSLRLIKEMHATLLTGVRGREASPGEFRKLQVCIGSDRRYVPPPAQYLDPLLNALESYVHTDDGTDPLIKCYLVHYQFEAIHPFRDGNGRVGRTLLALMIYKLCEHRLPWLYMSAFYERYKGEYIDKLFRVSSEGAWDDWIEFCLNGTIAQADDAIRRCDALQRLRDQYKERVGRSEARAHQIVDLLFRQPIVSITETAKRLGVSYQTANKDIQVLIAANILRPLTKARPRTFYANEVFHIAYSEPEDLSHSIRATQAPAPGPPQPVAEVKVSVSANEQSQSSLPSVSAPWGTN